MHIYTCIGVFSTATANIKSAVVTGFILEVERVQFTLACDRIVEQEEADAKAFAKVLLSFYS
jgi:hypothetical protein